MGRASFRIIIATTSLTFAALAASACGLSEAGSGEMPPSDDGNSVGTSNETADGSTALTPTEEDSGAISASIDSGAASIVDASIANDAATSASTTAKDAGHNYDGGYRGGPGGPGRGGPGGGPHF